MNLITIGSKFLDDAIVYNSGKLHNKLRVVGISPFSISDCSFGCIPEISYEKKMFNIECDGNLEDKINNTDYDYIVFDFLMASSHIYECTQNGKVKYFTKSNYFETKKDILSEKNKFIINKEIDPILLNDEEIKKKVQFLCEYLKKFIPKEKIILISWSIPYQYVYENKIVNDEFDKVFKYNLLIKKCETYFKMFYDCLIIDMPEKLLRISDSIYGNSICFTDCCKEFLAQSFLAINNKEKKKNLYDIYNESHKSYISTCIHNEPFVLKNFVGEYRDCYGNYINSKSKCEIVVNGSNSKVYIDEVVADRLKIMLYDNCLVEIGNGTTFANNCVIIADNHKIIMGNDNMLSTEVICKAVESDILIGNHVWIGYQACILGGSQINNGSIIGARSVINGIIPNNCIAVGQNARIVRKDIYWEREPYTDFVEKEEYAHFTEE